MSYTVTLEHRDTNADYSRYYAQGEPLASLISVYFETVIEDNTGQAMVDVHRELDHPYTSDLTLYPQSSDPKRQWAWQRMMASLFPIAVNKMLQEYTSLNGKTIVAISMPGGKHTTDLEIVFSGPNPTELVEATQGKPSR